MLNYPPNASAKATGCPRSTRVTQRRSASPDVSRFKSATGSHSWRTFRYLFIFKINFVYFQFSVAQFNNNLADK